MSYILEALKRAEAERERERGAVPGLNTQPLAAAAEAPAAPAWLRPALWAGGGAVVVLAGALGWRWFGAAGAPAAVPTMPPVALAHETAPRPANVQPLPVTVPPSTAPVPPAPLPAAAPVAAMPPVAAPAATNGPAVVSPLAVNAPLRIGVTPSPAFEARHSAQAGAPVTQGAGDAAVASRLPAAAPRPQAVPATAPTPPAPLVATMSAGPGRTVPPQTPTPTPAPAPAANDRVYASANELPGDARGGVPPLAIGGSIYSPDPAARFIVINGQVLHEGDEIANGLKLEKIELKWAVLNYKGYRFRVGY